MSRFVSGGTTDQPTERSEEWLKAQQAIEAKQLQKKLEGQQEGGKSLYETLQANKAAKQDAFEESIRLKNQFRALDDDEVEFLESVNEVARSKESAVRKDTAEQLGRFREQQQKSERPSSTETSVPEPESQESWAVTRKRKRDKGAQAVPGVKLRKASSAAETKTEEAKEKSPADGMKSAPSAAQATIVPAVGTTPESSTTTAEKPQLARVATSLGLANYSSDED